MKIKILQKNLKQSLNIIQKAIPSKPQIPILSSILCEIKDNKIYFTATDMNFTIIDSCQCQNDDKGKIAIPGKIFKDLIYSLNPGEVNLEVKEKELLIKTEYNKINIPYQSAEEYPDLPSIDRQGQKITAGQLDNVVKFVGFAPSLDQTRPVLTAMLFKYTSDKLEVVGTDGFRLTTFETKLPTAINVDDSMEENDKGFLIPNKAILEVQRIMSQIQGENVIMTIDSDLKQVKFTINDTELYVRLIDGDYPPYNQIIPPAFNNQFIVDGEMLLDEVKRASILAKNLSNIIKLKLKDDLLQVTASSPSYGEYQGNLSVKIEKTDNNFDEIAFNAKYILDFLNSIKPEEVWFGVNESLKPAMFRPVGQDDYRYVVMPFRVND